MSLADVRIGLTVLNGSGVVLGRVVHVAQSQGMLLEMEVAQSDGKEWVVDAQHIARVDACVWLKGPRQGFTIWPITAPSSPGLDAARQRPEEQGHDVVVEVALRRELDKPVPDAPAPSLGSLRDRDPGCVR